MGVKFKDGMDQNDVLIANVDGYKTCYVDTSVDDYYDNGQPPKYSMLGTFKGHDPHFIGIGQYGIVAHQNKINKNNHLQSNHQRTHSIHTLIANVDGWLQYNAKTILYGITIFAVIIIAIFTKKICFKYFETSCTAKDDFDKIPVRKKLYV